MSGLEVLGAIASVGQVIDLGVKVIKRMNEFRDDSIRLPKAFRHIQDELPVFIDILRETKTASDANQLSDSGRKALQPLMQECYVQIDALDALVTKMLPKDSDRGMARTWKAVNSFRYDDDIKEAVTVIRQYIQTLTHHRIASARNKDALPPEPLRPSFINRPFQRDADFVDRAVLAEIISQAHRSNPISRLALVGVGGVGKSQVAIEYAYRTRETSPDTWVFWVHAGSIAKLEEGYRQIGKAVGLAGWDEKDTDIFKAVYEWLCDEANGSWVMILDNADDLSVFTAAPPRHTTLARGNTPADTTVPQIRSFLPKSSTGFILITSRVKHVAFELTGNANHYFELEEMNEPEAILLLKKKLRGTYKEDEMLALVKTLDYMPLAISQAAAYISQRAPRVTVASYIEMVKEGSQDVAKLLETSVHESHRDPERSNSIVATWQISFQYVRQARPSAARLLSLICLFDRQWIPEILISGYYGEDEIFPFPTRWWQRRRRLFNGKSKAKKREDKKALRCGFEDDLVTLSDFLFIKTNAGGNSFSMHRLIQLTAKRWLECNGEIDHWAQRLIAIIEIRYPHSWDDNREGCDLLFPHAHQIAAYRPSSLEVMSVWAPLMKRLVEHASSMGYWSVAWKLSKTVFAEVKSVLGMTNEITLEYAEQLGNIMSRFDNNDEAEPLYRQIVEQRTKILGPRHPDTIRSKDSLASVLDNQRRLQVVRRPFSSDPDTNRTLAAICCAMTPFLQQEYQEAEDRFRDIYSTSKRVDGSWDDAAFFYTKTLALVLMLQEKYAEAEAMYRQLRAEQELSGSTDGGTLCNLALVLEKQDKDEEAEHIYRRGLQDYTDGDKIEVPAEAAALENAARLAHVVLKRGGSGEAEKLSRHVIERRKEAVGDIPDSDMGDAWIAHHTLAVILDRREQFEEALQHYKTAYEGMEKVAGESYTDTRAYLKDYTRMKEKMAGWAKDGQASPTSGPNDVKGAEREREDRSALSSTSAGATCTAVA